MNRFVTFLSLFSALICGIDCIDFCDLDSMDNVFNMGTFIYMTRCGEVWTFDPRMNRGKGGFFRDYSIYAFARNTLPPVGGLPIVDSSGGSYRITNLEWEAQHFRFFAISFADIECEDWWVDMERDCMYSAQTWNGISIIGSRNYFVNFKFLADIETVSPGIHPFGFPTYQNFTDHHLPRFWPSLSTIARHWGWDQKSYIHSGLFYKEDYRLFIGLKSILN